MVFELKFVALAMAPLAGLAVVVNSLPIDGKENSSTKVEAHIARDGLLGGLGLGGLTGGLGGLTGGLGGLTGGLGSLTGGLGGVTGALSGVTGAVGGLTGGLTGGTEDSGASTAAEETEPSDD